MNIQKLNKNLLLSFFTLIAISVIISCGGKSESQTEEVPASETEAVVEHPENKDEHPESDAETMDPPETVEKIEGEGADLEKTFVDAVGNTVYTHVETAPSFKGGDKAMYDYLKNNIKYPDEAVRKKAEGRIMVSFVVAANGSIRDVEVIEPHEDSSLNGEATRVVSNMPSWEPGMVSGKAVDTKFEIPIDFQLN